MKRLYLIIALGFLFFGNTLTGFAGSYDIKTMTPEIQQALSGRQSRYEDLQSYKSKGALGENNEGYIEVLQNEGSAKSVASQENRDRRIIYQAIVEQNGLGAQGLNEVEKVFAEVQRDKARSGDSIQLPSGAWSKK